MDQKTNILSKFTKCNDPMILLEKKFDDSMKLIFSVMHLYACLLDILFNCMDFFAIT